MADDLHSPSSSSQETQSFQKEEDGVEEEIRAGSDQLSLLTLLLTFFRKSSFWVSRKTDSDQLCVGGGGGGGCLEIGWPTNVRHVAHVTFDRFNGFLGLPVEFEPEVPLRAPSASTTVFGVSTESMQLSYDPRGNSVPTILLLMQQRLYSQGGLQAEGIFRINAENSQEEFVRNQLNSGVVPAGIDLHCLAGLIKAWFRELPAGILDTLSPEQVMQCQSGEECSALVRLLPATEAALLNWAINLMADVVQQEHFNKMNAHNIAMVFAPNMTQMADPLTALMYAVQVMNFLKALIGKTIQTREDSIIEPSHVSYLDPTDESGHQGALQLCVEVENDTGENEEMDEAFTARRPFPKNSRCSVLVNNLADEASLSFSPSTENFSSWKYSETPTTVSVDDTREADKINSFKLLAEKTTLGNIPVQSSESNENKILENLHGLQLVFRALGPTDGSMVLDKLSRANSMLERIEL